MNIVSNSILDTVVLYLYSPVQQAFHVETVREHLNNNLNILFRGTATSTAYLIIAIFPNRDTYEREHQKFRDALLRLMEKERKREVDMQQVNQTIENILKGDS